MPLDKLILIIVCVLAAAMATIWLATLLAAAIQLPLVLVVLIPIGLFAWILWRVIADRLGNAEDDYYDKMDN